MYGAERVVIENRHELHDCVIMHLPYNYILYLLVMMGKTFN